MPFYRSVGQLPQKRFTQFRRPGGLPYYEHIFTADGFVSEASILYRLRSPVTYGATAHMHAYAPRMSDEPLCRNMLCQAELVSTGGDFLAARQPMFCSEEITFSIAKPDAPMSDFYRNAYCDELITVVQGSGVLQSQFGDIAYRAFDILFVPRGDTIRFVPDKGPHILAVVESLSPLLPPGEYRKANGQFHEHAPYHERDIRGPEFREPVDEEGEFPIIMKSKDRFVRLTLNHHPFDVMGWDGYYYPWALNMDDFEPLSGRIALMPDRYAIFSNANTMVSCITPRRLADHPDATALQPFHSSIDFDEVLYRFTGTTGATEPGGGTFTLHPRGIGHGPKPGFEKLERRERQDAYAFMVDTRATLNPSAAAMEASDPGYAKMMLGD